MDLMSGRKSAADTYPRILSRRRSTNCYSRRRDMTACQPAMFEHSGSAEGRLYCGFHNHRLNRKRSHYPLAHLKGSAREAGEHLHSLATGGEAEPSPPWQVCLGYAFTQPPPTLLRYGAGLARQTFVPRLCLRQRAGCLRTSPQNPVSPARWWSSPRPRRRQLLHHRSPSTGWGGPSIRRHGARRVACRFLHQSICIAGGHETQIEEVRSERGNA